MADTLNILFETLYSFSDNFGHKRWCALPKMWHSATTLGKSAHAVYSLGHLLIILCCLCCKITADASWDNSLRTLDNFTNKQVRWECGLSIVAWPKGNNQRINHLLANHCIGVVLCSARNDRSRKLGSNVVRELSGQTFHTKTIWRSRWVNAVGTAPMQSATCVWRQHQKTDSLPFQVN